MSFFQGFCILSFLGIMFLFPLSAKAIDERFAIDLGLLDQKTLDKNTQAARGKKTPSSLTHHKKKKPAISTARTHKQRTDPSSLTAGNQGLTLTQRLRVPESSDASYHLDAVRQVWPKLVDARSVDQAPIEINGQNFSLAIDPARFITLPAADGGTILLDSDGTIPPMVRSIVEGVEPRVRIVTASPAAPRSFYRSILEKARFYSVTENFTLEYGTDPKLAITSDFKIEKSADSIFNNDIVLLTVDSRYGTFPAELTDFLRHEGYIFVTPGMTPLPLPAPNKGTIYPMAATAKPADHADHLLKALSLPFATDQMIELYDRNRDGITLNIKVSRSFSEGGQQFVIGTFDGDPVTYTLIRLLETRGFRVIMLEEKDNFRRVTEKILGRLKIPSRYGMHDLVTIADHRYGINMSGFVLNDAGRQIVLTDRTIPALHRSMMELNGYRIATP